MKSKKVLRWVALASVSVLGACGGVSSIGSGDDPGKGGTAGSGMSSGGTNGDGTVSNGMGAESMGAKTGTGGTKGTGMGTAGKDPGAGGESPGTGTTGLCMTDMDCPDSGKPCDMCADGTVACNKTYCNAGMCVNNGNACATKCASDKDCPVTDMACTDCGDGTKACPTSQCLMGTCQTSLPGCGNIDPCQGLACGAACNPCGTGKMCDPKQLSYCGNDGKCEPGIPQCSSTGMCETPMDCGTPPTKCVPCGNDTCATFDCVKGSCELACPANPNPECKVSEDCPAVGDVCKMCQSGKCAEEACLKGSCELVCPL